MEEQTFTQKTGVLPAQMCLCLQFATDDCEENVNVLFHLLLRHHVLFVLLCDAVARGIIQSLTGPDQSEPALPADEGKKRDKKETKISRSPRDSLDAAAGRDVLKALQVGQAQHSSVNISIC